MTGYSLHTFFVLLVLIRIPPPQRRYFQPKPIHFVALDYLLEESQPLTSLIKTIISKVNPLKSQQFLLTNFSNTTKTP